MWLFTMVHCVLSVESGHANMRRWQSISLPHAMEAEGHWFFFDKPGYNPVFLSFLAALIHTCLGCVHYTDIGRDSRPRLTGVHHSASVRLKYLATLKYLGRY